MALAKLRSGAALDIAFEETLPPSKVLADAMIAANLQLKRAIDLASKVNPADINETTAVIAKEISAQARILSLFVTEMRGGDVAK
ncbi:hypothetical protein ACI2OW_19115 [Pseudomonas shirazica]|uniref:hypothetical protein n=1 Tax=Pseudomonas TaxID=286 RepID=UPI003852FCAE